ncbi:CsxC family protein [Marinisporobacter balticus]|uniref:SipL SPOCS domain-containing protein n=1 Tax=Marinisporobacter balticus TaxID=2018667 RepID=A0A4R2L1J5_9FIRM|nr:hypothetical protein [Marinisporobacter balticus]TCO79057.1 hypothetical protein EV214_103108 [Marinisporobacter balticus]
MPWNKYNLSQNQKIYPKKPCVSITGNTLTECENIPVPITSLQAGAIAKIPVVLAELNLQIDVSSIINLPEPALEVKQIHKRLKITQCLLLQDTNKLFIKGFVRKNIDYATRGCCSTEQGVCGDIKHCTIDVPFECVTPVTFNGIAPLPVVTTTREEFEYFKREDLKSPNFAEKDNLLSGDFSEFNQISTEYFNELPFCELINSRIVEFDEYLNRQHATKGTLPFEEKLFSKIEEKMVIELTLKILQNRQVRIPPCITD